MRQGVAQPVPEPGIAPLQVRIERDVAPEFGVHGVGVGQVAQHDDDETPMRIAQHLLVGRAELELGPGAAQEVLRQYDQRTPRTGHRLFDLVRDPLASHPVAVVQAPARDETTIKNYVKTLIQVHVLPF